MAEFQLISDPKAPNWVDVKYPHESRPRYMINLKNKSCTCKGNSMGDVCKHLKELFKDG